MSMDKFYSKCGKFLNSFVVQTGVSPQAVFVAHFYYQFGNAKYDGRNWQFVLNE
jgi:hypothetical protein